jgi:hypothetical protein
MRHKGFSLPLILLVMLTVPSGCDNVEWSGTEVNLQAPPPPPGALDPATELEEADEPELEPVVLAPLIYLVERGEEGRGTLLPVAQLQEDGFASLPDPAETPELVDRFPLDRWEEGTEFILFGQGSRIGTFIADGTSQLDERYCLSRAAGSGVLQLRPDAVAMDRFLAMRRDDLDALPSALDTHPAVPLTDEIRNASLDGARTLIPARNIPWPPTVLGIRRRIDAFSDSQGNRMLAASFVFGDDLVVGTPEPLGYSLFLVSREDDEDEFTPIFSWYQRADAGEKTFPAFLAAHDLLETGEETLLLEVFGQETRWMTLLGHLTSGGDLLYQDPCGIDPIGGAFQGPAG